MRNFNEKIFKIEFTNICKEIFHPLIEKYNLKFTDTIKKDYILIQSVFKNNSTAIIPTYDRRESIAYVRMVRLKKGEIGLYSPIDWKQVEVLCPNKEINWLVNYENEFESLKNVFQENANILNEYGDSILKGDFSLFDKINSKQNLK